MNLRTFLLFAGTAVTLLAGPRIATNYEVIADSADAGGARATSANLTHDGSCGVVTGVATPAVPSTATKHGFIGQLSERTGFVLTAAASGVNEGESLQLSSWELHDDDSLMAIPGASVAWSVQSGPLTGIDASGLVATSFVYQDAAASALGSWRGESASIAFDVVNVSADDFGTYAGDGIADAWQVQHFGEDNPAAMAGADPDGDGQNNHFEFTAGVTPTDPRSRFLLRIAITPEFPPRARLAFSPRLADRNYAVQFRTDLRASAWEPLLESVQSDDEAERTVTDLNTSSASRFYRVEITKP